MSAWSYDVHTHSPAWWVLITVQVWWQSALLVPNQMMHTHIVQSYEYVYPCKFGDNQYSQSLSAWPYDVQTHPALWVPILARLVTISTSAWSYDVHTHSPVYSLASLVTINTLSAWSYDVHTHSPVITLQVWWLSTLWVPDHMTYTHIAQPCQHANRIHQLVV